MVKRVLMVAFHYPPLNGGSGVQRAHSFSQYLPQSGWQPLVLAPSPSAYPQRGGPPDAGPALVCRTPALDAGRHLAIRGRYPGLLAQPDRWLSWWLSAVPAGLALIRRHRPQLIWSSYPIATTHLVALALHRLSGLPWVADQRDPLTDDGYPTDPLRHRIHRWIERQAARRAAAVVCTAPGALARWQADYPELAHERLHLIENGYDEAAFRAAIRLGAAAPAPGPFRLLHSGVVYPSERDPSALFEAMACIERARAWPAPGFRLVLRACGHEPQLRALASRHGVGHLVEWAPALPHQAALAEMLTADGLLLLQAANCNRQVPAKLYEYLRARRPLLALTDPHGDTAAVLRAAGAGAIAPLHSATAIAAALQEFLHRCQAGAAALAEPGWLASRSRAGRSRDLAALFDRLTKEPPCAAS
ncbi:glycosyltransferase [Oxalobacteraceae bacterium A2-2]